MIVWPDNEWLQAALRDKAPRDQVIDWMQDQQMTLGNVLSLFAGLPPDYNHVIGQGTLVRWLEVTEPDRMLSVATRDRSMAAILAAAGRAVMSMSAPVHTIVAGMRPKPPAIPVSQWHDRFRRPIPEDRKSQAIFAGYVEVEGDYLYDRMVLAQRISVSCPACRSTEETPQRRQVQRATTETPLVVRVGTVSAERQFDDNLIVWAGDCPTCEALVWAAQFDTKKVVIPHKQKILDLFPDVKCPAQIRCRKVEHWIPTNNSIRLKADGLLLEFLSEHYIGVSADEKTGDQLVRFLTPAPLLLPH